MSSFYSNHVCLLSLNTKLAGAKEARKTINKRGELITDFIRGAWYYLIEAEMAGRGSDFTRTIKPRMTGGLRSGREVNPPRSWMVLDLLHKQESRGRAADAMTEPCAALKAAPKRRLRPYLSTAVETSQPGRERVRWVRGVLVARPLGVGPGEFGCQTDHFTTCMAVCP